MISFLILASGLLQPPYIGEREVAQHQEPPIAASGANFVTPKKD